MRNEMMKNSEQPQNNESRTTDEWQHNENTVIGVFSVLFIAFVLVFTPRYLQLEGLADSVVTWFCYVVSVFLMLFSLIGLIGLISNSPTLRALIRELWRYFVVTPIRIVSRKATPDFWASTFFVAFLLGVAASLHHLVIVALGVTGPVELIVRILVLVVFGFGSVLMAVVVANLAVKPLFLEFSPGANAGSRDIGARVSRVLRRIVVTIILVAEVVAAAVVVWQVTRLILKIFG
jgi:hypothetical protein